jgi:hypothetical protein
MADMMNVPSTIGAIDPAALDINRQKMLASMLMGQGQQPQGQMVGRIYVAPSPLQRINALAGQLMGAKAASGAMNQEAQLSTTRNQQIADILAGRRSDATTTPGAPSASAPTAPTVPTSSQSGVPYYLQNPNQPNTSTPPPTPGTPPAPAPMNTSDKVTALMQLAQKGYPQAMEYAKLVQSMGAPIADRGYGIGRIENGQYIPYASSIQQIKDAETVKEGVKLIDVPTGDGHIGQNDARAILGAKEWRRPCAGWRWGATSARTAGCVAKSVRAHLRRKLCS